MEKTSIQLEGKQRAVSILKAFISFFSIILPQIAMLLTAIGPYASAQAQVEIPATTAEPFSSQHPAIPFIPNRGQIQKSLLFYAYTDSGLVYVTETAEIIYALPNKHRQTGASTALLRERLLKTGTKSVHALHPAATRINIFSGNDSKKWFKDLPTFSTLSLGKVYSGIEVQLQTRGSSVEKLFLVNPGAKPEDITISLVGGSPRINMHGELEVRSIPGNVRFSRPLAYQEHNGTRHYVDVAYKLTTDGYGFTTAEYDRTRPLIIDPILAATYVGGSDEDTGLAMALNSQGQVYIAGRTQSADLPGVVPGISADSTFAGQDEAFIARLDADLNNLLAVTFLGGSGPFIDSGRALAIDGSDNVYLAGSTNSPDFPGVNAASADSTFVGNSEAFVTKLSADLGTIVASTFLGGSSDEDAIAMVIDGSGDIIIGGSTNSSPDFPGVGVGSADPTVNFTEGIVAKLDANLSTIINATYLGGSGATERVEALAVDAAGNIYATGVTGSDDFPGVNAASADDTFGPMFDLEAFIAKLDNNLSTVLAASYAGGDDQDSASAITLANGDAYIGGRTSSVNFPGISASAADNVLVGSEDAFVARLNSDLTTLSAASYLGGSGNGDVVLALVADAAGNIYAAGETTSKDFPGVGVSSADSDPGAAGAEAFITRLDADLENILAATYLGGDTGSEFAFDIALDAFGNLYVGGVTGSADFPGITPASADSVFSDGEAFVARLDPDLSDNPPDCDQALPSIDTLWPPNHKLVPVSVLGVTDPEGTPITISIDSITQDEGVKARGTGNTCPDAAGINSETAVVRAERSGSGDGRIYQLSFTASDAGGKQCNAIVEVCVPQRKKESCVNSGVIHDSTLCP